MCAPVTAHAAAGAPLRWLADAAQLALIWLMIPAAILLFGLPIVLVIRALVEIGGMLFGG
jgi:hypothetical protein